MGLIYTIIGLIVGLTMFVSVWMLCRMKGGVVGFLLGWIPAAIAGFLSGIAWPLVLFIGIGIAVWTNG